MKTPPTLVESLLPVRNRMVRDETIGTYDVPSQLREFSVDGRKLPADIRASDGGDDGAKIIDKIKDTDQICWVARAVYGSDNPRWRMFREWLLADAPAWLRNLYIARGESFAAWISNKPALKAVIRRWMDRRIQSRPVGIVL
jgi:hypothetical protein